MTEELRKSRDEPRYPNMEQQCSICGQWSYRMWYTNPALVCFWCASDKDD